MGPVPGLPANAVRHRVTVRRKRKKPAEGARVVFDVGFWELVLVGVVALLVFGPERLPRVARETALWIRKVRSMVASVKSEIDQELHLQELRQTLLEEKRKVDHQSSKYQRLLHRKVSLAEFEPTGEAGKQAETDGNRPE